MPTIPFQCRSFRHIDVKGTNYCASSNEKLLINLFIRLLYFSVSNSTLCGKCENCKSQDFLSRISIGITDIQPNKWYTDLTVALQVSSMLLP